MPAATVTEKKSKKSKKEKKEKKDKVAEETTAAPAEPTEAELKAAKKAAKNEKKRKAEEAAEAPSAVAEAEPPAKKSKKDKKEKKSKQDKKEAEAPEADVALPSAPKAVTESNDSDGIRKVYCGNLPFNIDDDQIKEFFKDCGEIEEVFWVTDKETGKFYGTGFVTFTDTAAARKACTLSGTDCGGRPIKVELSKPRAGGATPKKGGAKNFEQSEKPPGCVTCFLGNLSYDIDDDQTKAFFKDCGEIAKIRWISNRDTGEFKGCGFIEFYETEATDKAVKLSGTDLLGRAIRIDYAKARER